MGSQSDQQEKRPSASGASDNELPSGGGGRRKPVAMALWVIAALIFLVVATTVAFGAITSSPLLCATCHEIRPQVASWRVSPHAEVACYSCHATPQPWYRWPQSLAERGALLNRDLQAHFDGGATLARANHGTTPVPDSTCLHCHNATRTATSRFGVIIDHAKHAKRNKSCTSCHVGTAHPAATGDRDTLMMKQCFTCHGLATGAKAPGTCPTCHIKGIDLHPVSHKTGGWQSQHGKVAMSDRKQCEMCHRDSFCQDCHGLKMPHPEGWARGKNSHAVAAEKSRTVCMQCHKGRTNLCTMCHHKGFDEAKGPWLTQHRLMVQETGSAFCMQCHEATFCVDCHSRRPAASPVVSQ